MEINFGKNRYAGYSESDENLDKLWKIILENKDIKKKYLKYTKTTTKLGYDSKKEYPKFKGDKIKTMGLAVFIDYKKELSKLTKDKNLKLN